MKHVHIGYGDSATACLKEAMELHKLPGDDAIPSRDDFTQGPISEWLTGTGIDQRIEYWRSIASKLNHDTEVESFYRRSIHLLEQIQSAQVTLWVGDSCHDMLATGWLLDFFADSDFDWYWIDFASISQNDYPSGLPPVNLAMYSPDQIGKLWKYRKVLDENSKHYFIDAFRRSAKENGHYRIQLNN